MKRLKRDMSLLAVTGLASLVLASVGYAQTAASAAPLDPWSSAEGRSVHMHMLMERTIFKVNVLTLDVWLGGAAADRIEGLVEEKRGSREFEDAIAEASTKAQDAYVLIEFLRDVSLEQFLEGVNEDLVKVAEAGVISQAEYERVLAGMPIWYAFLEERGVLRGDQMHYRVSGNSLHTQYRSVEGEILLDQVDAGESPRLAMLGTYFVRDSSFRDDLIKSLSID